ncbi:MAG: DNA polymerase III subunit delta' [Deltaproteobacteria bacterium]|nr:DNA polymerase III subunit delta' [Deltaproteobacteria bacterium]
MDAVPFQLLGQSSAARDLAVAIRAERLHHALLFAGPEGVGKFQAALQVATRLMCKKAKDASACGTCANCKRARASALSDVYVLDPDGDSIKVDDVREATRMLHIAPLEGPHKVLVVRDAERMNPSAQNALLKTLEEPPGRARIILTSSVPDALLVTVLSRCHRIAFRPVPVDEIARLVMERQGLDEGSARLLASLSKGSIGRALATDVEALRAQRDRARDLDAELSPGGTGGIARALSAAETFPAEDLGEFLDILGVWLRDQVLLALGGDSADVANSDRLDELSDLAKHRSLTEVLRRARALDLTRHESTSPYNPNRRVVVEQLCLALAGEVYLPSTADR